MGVLGCLVFMLYEFDGVLVQIRQGRSSFLGKSDQIWEFLGIF
jgi:hypothetical protein